MPVYYMTAIALVFLLAVGTNGWADHCNENAPSKPPEAPAESPSPSPSTGPSTAPSTPSLGEPSSTKDQLGLTLNPGTGGGSTVSDMMQGDKKSGGETKTFGPKEFNQLMRTLIAEYNKADKAREKRIQNAQIVEGWKKGSGWNEAKGNLDEAHERYDKALRTYHAVVQPKVNFDQDVLQTIKGDLHYFQKHYRENPAASRGERQKREEHLRTLEGAARLTEEDIQKKLEQPPNRKIQAERDAARQNLEAAQNEFEAANQRMDRLEARWKEEKRTPIPDRWE